MNVLVAIGSAPGTVEDFIGLNHLVGNDVEFDYMAVGIDAARQPIPVQFKYGATGHNEDIRALKAHCLKIIHQELYPRVDIIEPLENWEGGSSALMGVMAAIRMGYEKIVLCGVPLVGDNPRHKGARYEMFQARWTAKEKELLPFVRSLSGWTEVILGGPTKEWLNEKSISR